MKEYKSLEQEVNEILSSKNYKPISAKEVKAMIEKGKFPIYVNGKPYILINKNKAK